MVGRAVVLEQRRGKEREHRSVVPSYKPRTCGKQGGRFARREKDQHGKGLEREKRHKYLFGSDPVRQRTHHYPNGGVKDGKGTWGKRRGHRYAF